MVTRARVESADDGAVRLVPVAPDHGEPFTLDLDARGTAPLRRLRGQTVTAAGTGWTDCSGSISAPWVAGLLLTPEQAAQATPPFTAPPALFLAVVLGVLAVFLRHRRWRRSATLVGLTAVLLSWAALGPAPAPTGAGWPFLPADQRSAIRSTWFGGTRVPSSVPVGADRLVEGVLVFTDADAFWRSVFWEALTGDVNDAPDLKAPLKEALRRALAEGGAAFRAVDAERESLTLGLYAPNPEDDATGAVATARLTRLLGLPATAER